MTRRGMRAAVLEKVRELDRGGQAVTVRDVGEALGVQTYEAERRVRGAVDDLVRCGELERREGGLRAAPRSPAAPDKKEVMFRYLRIRGKATVLELAEIAGTSVEYAGQYLRLLAKRGLAQLETPGKCPQGERLYRFTGRGQEPPVDEDKNQYLRLRRQRLKEALGKLDAAFAAVAEARAAVSRLEAE